MRKTNIMNKGIGTVLSAAMAVATMAFGIIGYVLCTSCTELSKLNNGFTNIDELVMLTMITFALAALLCTGSLIAEVSGVILGSRELSRDIPLFWSIANAAVLAMNSKLLTAAYTAYRIKKSVYSFDLFGSFTGAMDIISNYSSITGSYKTGAILTALFGAAGLFVLMLLGSVGHERGGRSERGRSARVRASEVLAGMPSPSELFSSINVSSGMILAIAAVLGLIAGVIIYQII